MVQTSQSVMTYTATSDSVTTVVFSTTDMTYTTTLSSDTTILSLATVSVTQTLSASTTIPTAFPTDTTTKFPVPNPASGKGQYLPGFDINVDYTKTMPAGQLVSTNPDLYAMAKSVEILHSDH